MIDAAPMASARFPDASVRVAVTVTVADDQSRHAWSNPTGSTLSSRTEFSDNRAAILGLEYRQDF